MSKKSGRSLAWRSGSAVLIVLLLGVMSCSRGADEQIAAARRFSDAVTRNDIPKRDSMIATGKFKEYFANAYVGHDMIVWFQTFYNYKEKHFLMEPSVDVDRHLENDLEGAMLDTNKIEETGMVKVKSPIPGEDAAYFWMVHQHGQPWRVAIVTKGEAQVNFR
jgi:hypothetical protein